MEVVNGVPMVPVSINDGPAKPCLLDTGANVSSIRWDLATASGIKRGDPAILPGPRVRSLSAAENTQAIVLDRVRIGGAVFGNVAVSLYDDAHMPWVFGKIGNGLFEAFRLTLDARNKQVILEH
jgi:hypothetical protein